MGSRKRSRWSSSTRATKSGIALMCIVYDIAVDGQPRASSSMTNVVRRMLPPGPPISSGTLRPIRPARPRASICSRGKRPVRSTSSAFGANSSRATFWATRFQRPCSVVSAIPVRLRAFGIGACSAWWSGVPAGRVVVAAPAKVKRAPVIHNEDAARRLDRDRSGHYTREGSAARGRGVSLAIFHLRRKSQARPARARSSLRLMCYAQHATLRLEKKAEPSLDPQNQT